jgi:DnaK suppressor protein
MLPRMKSQTLAATARQTRLRELLYERRHALQEDVKRRLRDGRTDRTTDVREELESTDVSTSTDVSFALLEMKSQTLRHIDQAISRIGTGDYGACTDCGGAISETRLRALPFAVRCKTCEEGRERDSSPRARLGEQRESLSLTAQR